jgi:hypothetical protein
MPSNCSLQFIIVHHILLYLCNKSTTYIIAFPGGIIVNWKWCSYVVCVVLICNSLRLTYIVNKSIYGNIVWYLNRSLSSCKIKKKYDWISEKLNGKKAISLCISKIIFRYIGLLLSNKFINFIIAKVDSIYVLRSKVK